MMLEPAHSLIEYLGGPKAVAAILDRHLSRIYRWTYPVERGGTGGLIPSREQRRLIDYCVSNDIDLRPADFFSPERVRELLAHKTGREAAE